MSSVGCRCPTFKASFPFSRSRLLQARSRQPMLLERSHVAHSGFIDQILQLAAVPNGCLDIRDKFLWNVNGEPAPLVSAIKGVTTVAFAGCTNAAVLTDARTFTERQGTSGHGPKLSDRV